MFYYFCCYIHAVLKRIKIIQTLFNRKTIFTIGISVVLSTQLAYFFKNENVYIIHI